MWHTNTEQWLKFYITYPKVGNFRKRWTGNFFIRI